MQNHQKNIHDGMKRYSCSSCEYKAFHKTNLLKHQEKRHIGENCRQLKIGCRLCVNSIDHTVHETKIKPKILPVKKKTNTRVRTKNIDHTVHETKIKPKIIPVSYTHLTLPTILLV